MPDKIVNHFVLADGSTAKYDAGALLNLDDTVSLAGYAPDAKAVGDRLTDVENLAETLNEGGLELKDDVIAVNVEDWLDTHPEATTTVQDDSLTTAKYKDGSVTTPKLADGAVTSAKVDADFLKEIKNAYVTPEQFGAVGDGVADDTDAVKSALNSGNSVYFDKGKTYIVDTITISNISGISIFGAGLLKRKADASLNAIVRVSNCHNINIYELNTDGNIAENGGTVAEAKISLRIDNGSSYIHIGRLLDKNPSGDTLYLNNCNNISVGLVVSNSDNYTGRNALSIIKAENVYISVLVCQKTGYSTMPGGICLEPNSATDAIKHVKIGKAVILTDGTYGFTISNASYQADISDITIPDCYIEKAEKTSNRNNGCVTIHFAKRVFGRFIVKQTGENVDQLDNGFNFGNIDTAEIELYCDNAQRGMFITGVISDVTVKGTITNSYQNAIQLNNTANSKNNVFDFTIGDLALSGSGAVVMVSSGAVASGVKFKGDFSKKNAGGQCFRFEGTISDMVADGVDMSNWATNNKVYGANAGSGGFIGYNCKNYNYLPAQPNGYDGYTQGTVVYNTQPANGVFCWVCTASGKTGTWVPINTT